MSRVVLCPVGARGPQASRQLWQFIARLWRDGLNTLEIAQALEIKECAVYNSLTEARSEGR